MTTFLGPDFLLDTPAARHLYHDVAVGLPIVDYHNHLIPEQIASDKKWDTIGEVWLAGDHYKWRAMRWAGIEEEKVSRLCFLSRKIRCLRCRHAQMLWQPALSLDPSGTAALLRHRRTALARNRGHDLGEGQWHAG